MVIGDWSPWPVIAQRYLIQPLIRISKSPQELILQLAGIPKDQAKDLSLSDAFNLTRKFDGLPISRQAPEVLKLLNDLAQDPNISEIELKFLATYFRPRLGDNISVGGFGPFQQLRHPTFALLHSFYGKRYSPEVAGSTDNIFSNQQNFQYLKNLFDSGNVSFGITSVNDMSFYQKVKATKMHGSLKRITLSVTNIFDCGCYNGLTFSDFQKYIRDSLTIFKSAVTVHRTTNNVPPHGYYKYEVNTADDIPKLDEFDSSALDENYKQAG